MKFYKITTDEGLNKLVATQLDAKAEGVKNPEVAEVPTDKEGLMAHINSLLLDLHHATQSTPVEPTLEQAAPIAREPATDYSTWSVKLDDAWDKLPLARKLHFAALAMEDARDALP